MQQLFNQLVQFVQRPAVGWVWGSAQQAERATAER